MSGAMTIGELVGFIRADNSDFERGLARSQLRMEGFALDTNGRLRNLQGRFVDSGQVMERALTGVGDEMGDVARQTVVYSSVVDAEMRTMGGRMRAVREAADRMGDGIAARLGRVASAMQGFSVDTDRLGSLAGRVGGLAMGFGKVGAAVGAAVPLVAGLAVTVAQIAPAAGLAVTGLIAVQLASKALKLGMVGVKDAVSAALDPSNPQAYAEALKKLSPNARAFVGEIRTLQPQLKALQQGVQERLFDGLDKTLHQMGKTTLPILKDNLNEAATSLNFMGQGVGDAAIKLSQNGTLGTALMGANAGLSNLTQIPGQIVTGLTQIGAAAAPAFGRLTAAAGAGADSLSAKLSKAFADGSVQAAIEQAIGLIKQLGSILGNIGSIVGSVFGAASASGAGFLGTLEEITGALATAFSSPAVQEALGAIFDTMAKLASTAGPLLTQALVALAPVFTALAPPIQQIIGMLGPALGSIIGALGPVLEAAAVALGALLTAVSPLIPVFAQLITGLLPALTPILTMIADLFVQMAPLVAQLAGVLMSALAPILAALVPALQPIIAAFMTLTTALLPILTTLISSLAPVIAQLAGIIAQLMVALAPVIAQLVLLAADVLTALLPILLPIIEAVGKFAGILANELGRVINSVIMPAFQMITALLRGDFSAAWEAAKSMVSGAIAFFIRLFVELPGKAGAALAGLASALWSRVTEAGGRMVDGIKEKINSAVSKIRELPGMARSALGDLGSVLWNAGSRLISGLIDGIASKIGALKSKLGSVTNMIPDWKGPPDKDGRLLRPAGRLLMDGLMGGVDDRLPALQAQLGGISGAIPGMALAGAGGYGAGGSSRTVIEFVGPDGLKSLIRRIVQIDGRGSVVTAFE